MAAHYVHVSNRRTCRLRYVLNCTHVQRCYALLVGVCRIELAAVEQLLDGADLAQTRQLHNVLLDREAGLLVRHVFELMLPAAVGGCGHFGGPLGE